MGKKKTLALDPTRRSRIDAWFIEHRIKKADIARALQVSNSRLNQLLHGMYLSAEQKQSILRLTGIPEALLPEARE